MSPHQPTVVLWDPSTVLLEFVAVLWGGAAAGFLVFLTLAWFGLRWTWAILVLPPIYALSVFGPSQLFAGAILAIATVVMFGVASTVFALYMGGYCARRDRGLLGPRRALRRWRMSRSDLFVIDARPSSQGVAAEADAEGVQGR